MKFLRSPKSYPYVAVAITSLVMFVIVSSGKPDTPVFPLFLFLSAKLSVIFACIEIGLSYIGRYEGKEEVFKALSRAITALGMAMCFIVLVGAYHAARKA